MARFLAVHGLHLAGVVLAVAWIVVDRYRRRVRPDISPSAYLLSTAVVVAAAGLIGAAIVHVIVIPEHFEESTLYGVFFTVAATLQSVAAVLVIVRPSRLLLQAVAIGNGATVLLWAVTRMIGLPIGPEVGHPEAIGVLDVIATMCEILVVCAVVRLLQRGRVRQRPRLWARKPSLR